MQSKIVKLFINQTFVIHHALLQANHLEAEKLLDPSL